MAKDTVYRRNPDPNILFERPLKPGQVLDWVDSIDERAVVFGCPCGEREVYVTKPPHTAIEFDSEGLLTIHASLLSPKHGCHFWVRKGKIQMCGDSTCPGALASAQDSQPPPPT